MGTIHWISVDGSERTEQSAKWPSLEALNKFVGGYIEVVRVLYKKKPTTMIVNEQGATNWQPGYPLPVNKAATEIYHAFTISRGLPAPEAKIHGAAVILEGIADDAGEREEAGGEDEQAQDE